MWDGLPRCTFDTAAQVHTGRPSQPTRHAYGRVLPTTGRDQRPKRPTALYRQGDESLGAHEQLRIDNANTCGENCLVEAVMRRGSTRYLCVGSACIEQDICLSIVMCTYVHTVSWKHVLTNGSICIRRSNCTVAMPRDHQTPVVTRPKACSRWAFFSREAVDNNVHPP